MAFQFKQFIAGFEPTNFSEARQLILEAAQFYYQPLNPKLGEQWGFYDIARRVECVKHAARFYHREYFSVVRGYDEAEAEFCREMKRQHDTGLFARRA